VFLAKYYESAHVNHTALMRKAHILVGKSCDNIQHKVLDADGNTILKLIEHIQNERMGTRSTWLDQRRAALNVRTLATTKGGN